MTSTITLNAEKREKKSKRDETKIPAVLYGKNIDNISLWVGKKIFQSVYPQVGESTIFKVSVDGKDERNVLIKEVQKDILYGKPIHIDFYQVRMDEEIEATVEVEFIGESPAVKELAGVLVKNVDEIDAKCLPGDLPSKIIVDVSTLKTFEDYIYVKDLKVSDKVELLVDPETVVAMVLPPRSEEELAELDTEVKEDVTQVEGVVKEEEPASDESSTTDKSLTDKPAGKPESEESKTKEGKEEKAKKKE
ncbi:MAG: 50S ribosomal protein L25 [Patescibacteria group bacterium]|nr:50S ribosomal protein L25 [Patescibacteria group bacterium]